MMGNEALPIADDELIYRRIPASQGWYDPESTLPLSPKAFRPRSGDNDGISVTRASFRSPAEEAKNNRGVRFFVATLCVGDIRKHGMDVVAQPIDGNPGHAIIPELRYESRKETDNFQQLLAHRLCHCVVGPLPEEPNAA